MLLEPLPGSQDREPRESGHRQRRSERQPWSGWRIAPDPPPEGLRCRRGLETHPDLGPERLPHRLGWDRAVGWDRTVGAHGSLNTRQARRFACADTAPGEVGFDPGSGLAAQFPVVVGAQEPSDRPAGKGHRSVCPVR